MYQADLTRLKLCMERAGRGEEVTVAFLGGSITQGSLASDHSHTYAYRVFEWWKRSYPDAVIHYVNAGIGGTTSHYGVSRVVTDVLVYQPDFVVVDFSVNDDADSFFQETYEGTLRRLLSWESKPAVLLLNNVFYDTGANAQEYHNEVGAWYRVPYVSIKDTVYQRMKAGAYRREELTSDGLHPSDKGHELVADEIISFLEQVKAMEAGTGERIVPLPLPMTANSYENAKRLTCRDITPVLSGFCADDREKNGYLDHFKQGWTGKQPGDGILFEVEASCIAVQYRKTIKRPAVSAEVIVDEDRENAILLDGNNEENWGEWICLQPVLHHGKKMRHTVELLIPETQQEGTPFYLLSFIIA